MHKLVLIRHGESVWIKENQFHGTSVGRTKKGRNEAICASFDEDGNTSLAYLPVLSCTPSTRVDLLRFLREILSELT